MLDTNKLSFVSKLQDVISFLLQDLNLTEDDQFQADLLCTTFKGYISKLEQVKQISDEGNADLTKHDPDEIVNPVIEICANEDPPKDEEISNEGDLPSSQQLEVAENTLKDDDYDFKVDHQNMDDDETTFNQIKADLENTIDNAQRVENGEKEEVPTEFQGDVIIRCIFCDADFYSEKDAENHDQMNHMFNKEIKCNKCEYSNETKKLVVKHFLITHKQVFCFDCFKCDDFFTTFTEFKQHIIKDHDIEMRKLKKCPICDKDVSKGIQDHFKRHHLNMALPCNLCSKSYNCDEALKSHQKVHQVIWLSCDICGLKIKENNLTNHMARHNLPERSVKCTDCDRMYFTEYDMLEHKKIHKWKRKFKDYVCTICGFTTKSHSNKGLERHMVTHSDERPYKCNQCDLTFKSTDTMISHKTEVHVATRNHECSYCKKKFKKPFALKRHLDIHIGNYRAQCEICDKRFVQLDNYKLHMRKKHEQPTF